MVGDPDIGDIGQVLYLGLPKLRIAQQAWNQHKKGFFHQFRFKSPDPRSSCTYDGAASLLRSPVTLLGRKSGHLITAGERCAGPFRPNPAGPGVLGPIASGPGRLHPAAAGKDAFCKPALTWFDCWHENAHNLPFRSEGCPSG